MRTGLALVSLGAVAFGLTYADRAPLISLTSVDLGLSNLQSGLRSQELA